MHLHIGIRHEFTHRVHFSDRRDRPCRRFLWLFAVAKQLHVPAYRCALDYVMVCVILLFPGMWRFVSFRMTLRAAVPRSVLIGRGAEQVFSGHTIVVMRATENSGLLRRLLATICWTFAEILPARYSSSSSSSSSSFNSHTRYYI